MASTARTGRPLPDMACRPGPVVVDPCRYVGGSMSTALHAAAREGVAAGEAEPLVDAAGHGVVAVHPEGHPVVALGEQLTGDPRGDRGAEPLATDVGTGDDRGQ